MAAMHNIINIDIAIPGSEFVDIFKTTEKLEIKNSEKYNIIDHSGNFKTKGLKDVNFDYAMALRENTRLFENLIYIYLIKNKYIKRTDKTKINVILYGNPTILRLPKKTINIMFYNY
jgi:hypothetical protein